MENQIQVQSKAFNILGGMMNSYVVSALIKHNIIESLSLEPKTLDELVVICHVNKNVLFRTLRYSIFIGIIDETNKNYNLTEVGKCFLKNVPGSLYGSASFINAPPWRDSWTQFNYCLKTGLPAFDHVMGASFFEFLATHDNYGSSFNHYMTTITKMSAVAVTEVYDFSNFETICDVGGGQGIMLKAILEKSPNSKGLLFDMSSALKDNFMFDFKERTQIIEGSFFDQIPIADCMILKTIIHDWNDENSIKILTKCRESLKPNGKIILIEQIIEEPYTFMSLFYDLHMQVMLGGSERTESEYEKLLNASGLKLIRIIPTKSPMKIIEASA